MKLTLLPVYEHDGMTTTCTLTCCVKYGSTCNVLTPSKLNRLFPVFVLKGQATCQEPSRYDASIGERLALHRAKAQAYAIYAQQMENLAKTIVGVCEELEDSYNKLEEYVATEKNQKDYLYTLVSDETEKQG